MSKKKLVYGVGINDAEYPTRIREPDYSAKTASGRYKERLVWHCPFYRTWTNMLKRCYSDRYQDKKPTYKGCTVSEEWKLFSNFRKWMVEQEWEGMQLDKDILVIGNKVYSAETCVFVTSLVNAFLTERGNDRGEWPIGVHWQTDVGKFKAYCNNPFTGKQEYLGYFSCPQQAHKAWLAKKLEHAYAIAAIQTNPLVAAVLIERYENYVSDGDNKEK